MIPFTFLEALNISIFSWASILKAEVGCMCADIGYTQLLWHPSATAHLQGAWCCSLTEVLSLEVLSKTSSTCSIKPRKIKMNISLRSPTTLDFNLRNRVRNADVGKGWWTSERALHVAHQKSPLSIRRPVFFPLWTCTYISDSLRHFYINLL